MNNLSLFFPASVKSSFFSQILFSYECGPKCSLHLYVRELFKLWLYSDSMPCLLSGRALLHLPSRDHQSSSIYGMWFISHAHTWKTIIHPVVKQREPIVRSKTHEYSSKHLWLGYYNFCVCFSIVKICKPCKHLFKIMRKQDWHANRNFTQKINITGQNVQRLQIFAILAS